MYHRIIRAIRNRRWLIAAILLAIVIAGSVTWGIYVRTRPPTLSLETPPPADLSQDYTGDPNDMENVPSFKEAMQYHHIVGTKHSLTDEQFDRVIILAGYTKYPATSIFSMSAGSFALEFMGNPEPFRRKLLDTVIANLKCTESTVRQSSISIIGNTNAKDRADAIVPFLKSPEPKERNAAKMALTKLGYKFPPDPKPME